MKYLLWSIALTSALVAAMTAMGYALPVEHTVSRDVVITATAPDLFATVRDVERYPEWWPEITQVEMISGDGRRFREYMSDGPVVMEVAESNAPFRFVTRIADPDQPFGGTWTFELTPVGSATRVTLTERGEVYNPLFRFLSRFVFGHAGTVESCLRALDRKHRTGRSP
jgi:ribosome-associated toxin RatA of RatAB toxin-antitoxin module